MNNEKLGDLVNIRTGKLDANASVEGGRYPFFTTSKKISAIDSYSYEGEVVLVAGNGDLNVKYYKGKFDAYQRTYILQSNNEYSLNMKYLYYYLDSYLDILRAQSIGGVIKYIKLKNLTDIKLPLPPIETQKKIADTLDLAQSLIEKRKEQLAEMDRLIQSVFYQMFGDPYKNNMNWEIGKIRDVLIRTQYGAGKKASVEKKQYPILRMNNLTYSGEMDYSNLK